MKIETTKGALLEAFGAVDLGDGGTPIALCGIDRRGKVVSISEAGFLRYHSVVIEGDSLGSRLRTEAFGTSYAVAAEATIADAYVSEHGRYIVDLATFRDAVKRLDKACGKSKRGARTPVTITLRFDGDPICIEAAGARVVATPLQTGTKGGPELYNPAAGQPFALRAEDVAVLSAITDEVGMDADAGYDSVAITGGRAFVTDGYFLATAPILQVMDDLAVPREVAGKLARSTKVVNGLRYDAQTAYAETGALRVSWRWHGEGACGGDRCLGNAPAAARMIDKALKSRPVTLRTADILRAARELKAFCTKGQSTLLLPHELGARLVRWDVKDGENAYIRENETWRAETVLPADWPMPKKFAINLGFLERVAKKTGEAIELLMGDELIAYRSPGSQIVRLSTQAVCPFEDREGI